MADVFLTNILEEAVRLRSYSIWEREGCPDGNALDHWLRAVAEIDAELRALPLLREPTAFVLPRMPISRPPNRRISARINVERSCAALSAATR
jgi:hypothetical protein